MVEKPSCPGTTDMSQANAADAVINTTSITKAFGDRVVVDHVDLKIRPWEVFGLIGPNGAGKSTLIKMLTTLLPPTSGEAMIAGFDLRREPRDVRASIGYVPQRLSADGALTGYENLLFSARLYLIPRREREQRIREALEMSGLGDVANGLAQYYSGGMLRRLEIIQSTLHRPTFLVMDEPTVGLDPVARGAIWNHIRELRGCFGTTILITTHVMDEAEILCDRVGIRHRGRLEKVGTPMKLKSAIGPTATLDDVFARVAGEDTAGSTSYGGVRLACRSESAHG